MTQEAYILEQGTGIASLEVISEVEQTLYREAQILDEERYKEWIDMMMDDVHYFMPGLQTRYRKDKTDYANNLSYMAFYNDNKEELLKRLARLETGTAWSEDPATRYCHLITNVEVELTEDPDEYLVYSNFLAHRNRNERDEDSLIGNRKDLWKRVDGKL
jgi:ethylbenzene dioxygenase beta subunit